MPTCANSKKKHKEMISSKFDEFVENSATFKVLKNAILEGFETKKLAAKKTVHKTLILDEVDDVAQVAPGGKVLIEQLYWHVNLHLYRCLQSWPSL
jgi:5-methylcytosine-specific restriction endonuclease McrBC regulatory subunit McrC